MRVEVQNISRVKLILGVIAFIFVLMFASCSAHVVDTGHRGVRTTFRKANPDELTEGFYLMIPMIQQIVDIDTRVKKWSVKDAEAYTRGSEQLAQVDFVLNYRLDPTKAAEIYQSVGVEWENKLIGQVVLEEIKAEFGQHGAVELISRRNEVSRNIEKAVTRVLGTRDVIVTGMQLTNISYSSTFEHAMEAKVVAVQKAIEEQNRTVQVQEQAKQAIETQRGTAEATILQAKADADAVKLRGDAAAYAIKAKGQMIDAYPKIIQYDTQIRWNGELPQVTTDGGLLLQMKQ